MLVLYILCLKLGKERKDLTDKSYEMNIENLKSLPEAIKKA